MFACLRIHVLVEPEQDLFVPLEELFVVDGFVFEGLDEGHDVGDEGLVFVLVDEVVEFLLEFVDVLG